MKSKILAMSVAGLLALPIAALCAQTAAADDVRLPPPAPLSGHTIFLPPKDMSSDDMIQRLSAPTAEPSEPYWSTSFTDQATHVVYKNIFMLGLNPELPASNRAVAAKVVVIPVIIKIGTTVFDPATIDTACEPKGSAITLIKKSPLFNAFTLKVGTTTVGTGQYPDLFQRGNFYAFIKARTPKYNLVLEPSYTNPITFTATGGSVFGACGKGLGVFDISEWDSFAQNIIQANPKLLPPNVFPFFIFYNVVLDQNNNTGDCCILGYHSALSNKNFANAFQAYGVGDFDSSRDFTGTSDISALSHEVDEWQDDPTGTNPTPSWGNIGQVSACQANLEVGDPLSGNIYPITMNGFVYHVQDLAFVSWFYETKPSIGSNGWYSLFGTDEKDADDSTRRNFKTTPAVEPCK